MATPVFCCGFECGQLGSAGQHFQSPINGAISTSTVRSGARSLRINPTASSGICNFNVAPTNITVIRFYIYFASLPTSDTVLFNVNVTLLAGIMFKQSDSKLYIHRNNAAVSAAGFAVTTGQWYLIDYKGNFSANPWAQSLSVDGATAATDSNAVAAETPTQLNFGSTQNPVTYDIFLDDVWMSQTNADYPYGAGLVNHFIGVSDGTHTSTSTNIVKGTIAAPTGGGAITNATTDAFNWINGVPLLGGASDNTRLINQQTASSAQYVEVVFGPASGVSTPTVAPRAVEVITADREASTATCNFITKLNDNGTENDVVNRGTVAGVTSDRYARKHYATAPTGGAWTVSAGAGNFNNIRARFGYSSDATPDVYWRGIMIEAEFAPIVPPSFVPRMMLMGVG